MSIKRRLKMVEEKANIQDDTEKEYVIIIGFAENKKGIKFERDGKIYEDIALIPQKGGKSILGSSEEGQRILANYGFKIIKKSS